MSDKTSSLKFLSSSMLECRTALASHSTQVFLSFSSIRTRSLINQYQVHLQLHLEVWPDNGEEIFNTVQVSLIICRKYIYKLVFFYYLKPLGVIFSLTFPMFYERPLINSIKFNDALINYVFFLFYWQSFHE